METLLTEFEAANRLRMKPGTLRRWRHESRGPAWLRIEGAIRYSQKELNRFLAAKQRTSTRPQETPRG
jgi:predicted site-specific integrase-resolvase